MMLVRALFVFAVLILPATSFALPVQGVPTAVVVVTGLNGPITLSAIVSANTDGTFTALLDTDLLLPPPTLFAINDLEVTFDPDPFVQYAFGVQNLSPGSMNFDLTFSTPFGGGPYSTLTSEHSSTVIDGGTVPDGTVVVTPFDVPGTEPPPTFIHRPQITVDSTTVAVGQLGEGCRTSDSPDVCDLASGSFPITPVSGPGTLSVRVAFTLSSGDLYSVNGRVELSDASGPTAVPEPSTFILGLGVLAGLLYRQRRG